MEVQVTGKQVDVGDALRTRVAEELTTNIGKYFERGGGGAEVVVAREGNSSFKVDCAVTLASGQQLTTHGVGGDAHMAFDAALAKMAERVRRYKNRLKDHHLQAQDKETTAYYVLQAPEPDDDDEQAEGEAAFPEPMVIAETEMPIRTMTVSMAVMDLDLSESQTIVFRNAAHGGLSVVYRRPDGNIGWVDPERTKSANGASDGTGGA